MMKEVVVDLKMFQPQRSLWAAVLNPCYFHRDGPS